MKLPWGKRNIFRKYVSFPYGKNYVCRSTTKEKVFILSNSVRGFKP